jgi:hypothetical protein
MRVDFRHASRELAQYSLEARLNHRPGPRNADDLVGGVQVLPASALFQMRDPRCDEPVATRLHRWIDGIEQPGGLPRHPQRSHAISGTDLQNLPGNGRMQVKMVMSIHVVERQAGCLIRRKLRLDFGGDLSLHLRPKENIATQSEHIAAQISLRVDKVGHALGRQRWATVDQDEVKAHAQRRKPTGARHCIVKSGASYHQAGRAQYSVGVCELDGLVDFLCQTEVVGGDDQRLQRAISRRSRRYWKNSTPSRRRRFII